MHAESHPLAGKTVRLNDSTRPSPPGDPNPNATYVIEDWWDLLTGGSWMNANGNPAAMKYAIRSGMGEPPLPTDDEVVYGKITVETSHGPIGFGHLVHASELGEVVE